MATDFFIEAAQQRAAELDADLAEMQAGLLRAKSDGDDHTARQLIQGVANAKAEKRNLEVTFNEYVASQQPQHQASSTEGEWMMKPADKMTGDDVSKIFEKSKYFTKGQWGDPEIAGRVHAGMREVERRRRSGQ
jgi:hypothetical protein